MEAETTLTNHPAQERQALYLGLGAVLLWSSVATGFKLGLSLLAVEQLLLLGSAISWLVFLLAAMWTGTWRVTRSDWGTVLLLGSINPFAYYLILFGAYERLPAHLAQPINYTWAITLALLAVPILGQRLSRRMLLGILVAYSGVVLLLATTPSTQSSGWDGLGVMLALTSTLLWAGYWLLNTRCKSPALAIMLWSFSAGLPCIAIACWLGPGWPALTLPHLAYGAWVGFIEMGITFLLWQRALRLTQHAARISTLIFISPFVSFVLIYFILEEPMSPWALAALCIIVTGLRLTQSSEQDAV